VLRGVGASLAGRRHHGYGDYLACLLGPARCHSFPIADDADRLTISVRLAYTCPFHTDSDSVSHSNVLPHATATDRHADAAACHRGADANSCPDARRGANVRVAAAWVNG
jgi:hypothetical protein